VRLRPPRIALLLKAPSLGAVKTRLAATVGEKRALAIYRQLTERQVLALPSGWSVTIYFDPPEAREQMARWLDPLREGLNYTAQGAGDLGARLTAAFAAEFARAPGPVLAIGGDCPGLDGAMLESGLRALTSHDVVLGPATDGGYYLIGLQQACPELFTDIAWSTPEVLTQTRARIATAAFTSAELPPLDDVDDEAGWHRAHSGGLPPAARGLSHRLGEWRQEHPGAFLLDAADPVGLAAWLRGAGVLTPDETVCSATKAGDGNMNCTLRVVTSHRSLVVKQARPWVEKYPQFDAPWDRALREMEFYSLVAGSAPVAAGLPRLLHGDRLARLLVLEDLGAEGDYSDVYRGGRLTMAEIAALAVWLSDLHGAFHGWTMRHGLANHDMRALNCQHIFILPFQADNGLDLKAITPGLEVVAAKLQQDRALLARVRTLAEIYLADGDCLLHGDYFPGSFLRTLAGPRIIDPEFAFFGRAEFDPAVFVAHLLLAGQPDAMAQHFLQTYRRPAGFEEALRRRLTGIEIIRRLIGYAQLPLVHDLATKTRLLEQARELILQP